MPRRPRPPISPLEALRKIVQAGVSQSPSPNLQQADFDIPIDDINTRIQHITTISRRKKTTDMLFFVMYDIESNKVRRYVVKYLQQKGLYRVQKSIFLGALEPKTYTQIKQDLAKLDKAYENNDSILVVPISTDQLSAMKIIGQNINIDLITRSKTTIIF